jgi:hypothetical protein
LIATYDNSGFVVLNTIYCGIPKSEATNLKFVVAVLNSKLIRYWFRKVFVLTDRLFPYVRQSQLNFIPVKKPREKELNWFAGVVSKIIEIKKSHDFSVNHSRQQKVEIYEKQIDQMVYKLYGLTPEEIKIVEVESI